MQCALCKRTFHNSQCGFHVSVIRFFFLFSNVLLTTNVEVIIITLCAMRLRTYYCEFSNQMLASNTNARCSTHTPWNETIFFLFFPRIASAAQIVFYFGIWFDSNRSDDESISEFHIPSKYFEMAQPLFANELQRIRLILLPYVMSNKW